MKHFLCLALGLYAFFGSIAQSSKQVQWNYSVKKIADKTFEVHMSATISGGFHLYAQDAGGDGPLATTFTFSPNPLVVMNGKVKETGNLISKYESAWKHDVKYYEKSVDFVQVIKLKANARTDFAGKVEFMVCNDHSCLPPSEVEIKVNVGS